MADAGVSDPDDLTEKLLVDAQASSAFSLNAWAGLETCSINHNPVDDPYVLDADPMTPAIDAFPNCKIGTYMGPCYCYHRFKNSDPTHPFNVWLEKFVRYKQCTSDGGRSGLIQIGPIFSFGRAVPAYLHDVPFDDAAMIKAFARFWDEISRVLAQAKFTMPANEYPRRPEWIISIGNEINLYLDDPRAIERANYVDGIGPGATDAQNVRAAWDKYDTFYRRAMSYVRGLPVDTDGIGGIDLPNTSTLEFNWVTFSTTWSGADPAAPPCTPGWRTAHPTQCPGAYTLAYLFMLQSSSLVSYTYYPFPFGINPATPGIDATFFYDKVFDDLNLMKKASENLAPATMGRQLPIVLQEVGYPSSWVDLTLPIPPGSYNNDNIVDQQEAFVEGSLRAFRDYNTQWKPELTWWLQWFMQPSPLPSESPWQVPRIVSYNAFMLHDFWAGATPACPFEDADPVNPGTGIPTKLGVFLCSLGLRTERGADKDAGAGKTPWGTFVQQATPITDPVLDPDRTCP
jgi:hypothetical protein